MAPVGIYPSNSAVQNWTIGVYNANEESVYQNKTLPEYRTALANWITLNTHSRELSATPAAYVPTAPPALPQKTVWSLGAGDVMQTNLVADPSIPDAVLPPYVGNQGTSIKSTAPPDPVMTALMAIYQQNQKIMLKLGIA